MLTIYPRYGEYGVTRLADSASSESESAVAMGKSPAA